MFVCVGCSKEDSKEANLEFFGPELYNAACIGMDGETAQYVIPVMSKIDLSNTQSIEVDSEGGTYTFNSQIESTEYSLDDFSLFNVVLRFSDIVYDKEKIKISTIRIYTDNKEYIELKPDRCEIISIEDVYSNEHISINGVPLKLPPDMTVMPLDLSADETVVVNNIYLTNQSMMLAKAVNENNEEIEGFNSFSMYKGAGYKQWQNSFGIENTELSKYKQYGTSIIIQYECEGENYYTTPAVSTTIYNPFDCDAIERYYNDKIKD